MIERIIAALSYIGLIPWVIIYVLFKDYDSLVNAHLKYSLIVVLLQFISLVFLTAGHLTISSILSFISGLLTILGIVYALLGYEEVPILSQIYENYLSQYVDQWF